MAKEDTSKKTDSAPAITSPLGTGLFGVPNITGVSGLGGGADAGGFYDPDELKYLRQYVDALQDKQVDKGGNQLGPLYGPNNTPHFTWSQGVSNMLNALRGQQLLNQILQNNAAGRAATKPQAERFQDPFGAPGGAPQQPPFTGAGQPPASAGGVAPSSQMLPPATVPGQPPATPPGPSPAGIGIPPPVTPFQWSLPSSQTATPPPGTTGGLNPQGSLIRPEATAAPGRTLALGEGLPPFVPGHPLETAPTLPGRGRVDLMNRASFPPFTELPNPTPTPPPVQPPAPSSSTNSNLLQALNPVGTANAGGLTPEMSKYMPQTSMPLGRGRLDLMNQQFDPRPNAAPPPPPVPTPTPSGVIATPPPSMPTPGMPTPPPPIQPSGVPPTKPDASIDPTQFLAGNKPLPGGWSPAGVGPTASLATPLNQGFATQQVPPAPNIGANQSLLHGLTPTPGGIDRSTVAALLQNRPDLVQRLGHMAWGEVGGNAPATTQMAQTETALNRMAERGQPLDQILLDRGQNPRLGYYPPATFRSPFGQNDLETFRSNILPQVLAGSDYAKGATGNASGSLAGRQFRFHPEQQGFTLPGGSGPESYFREGPYKTPLPRVPNSVNQPPAPKLPTPPPAAQPGAGMMGTHPNIPMMPFMPHTMPFMPMMGMGFGMGL